VTDEPVVERDNEPIDSEPVEPTSVEPAPIASEPAAADESSESQSSESESQSAVSEPVASEPVASEPAASTTTANGGAPTAAAVLTHVVRSIVDDADAVRVDAVEGRNRLKLEVKVGPGDLGRVIGRRGRTAQSIRTVVRAAATRDGVEVDVDFVD
jgi:predicted RNA-binding protein YlqC (UPF0109 family)